MWKSSILGLTGQDRYQVEIVPDFKTRNMGVKMSVIPGHWLGENRFECNSHALYGKELIKALHVAGSSSQHLFASVLKDASKEFTLFPNMSYPRDNLIS